MKLGLPDGVVRLPADDLGNRHVWLTMPVLSGLGLWLAQRRNK